MAHPSLHRAVKQPQVRILLVDDNAHGLQCRKSVLEEIGHKVTTATSGVDALEHFSPAKIDLVITDYKMPKMDGIELIAEIRKTAPHVPVVLISGFVDALGLSEESTGADAVIQKSANEVSHLVRAVARLLRKKKPAASAGPAPRAKKKKA